MRMIELPRVMLLNITPLHPIPFMPPPPALPESVQPALVPGSVRMPVPAHTPASVPTPAPIPPTAPVPAPVTESGGNSHFTIAPNGKETVLAWRPEDQSSQANAVGSGSGLGRNRADDLRVAELVRVLNERVNQGDEVQGDGPPVYRERPQ